MFALSNECFEAKAIGRCLRRVKIINKLWQVVLGILMLGGGGR